MAEDVAAREILEDARLLAANGEWQKLVALVTSLHPADLAELVLDLETAHRVELLAHLPTDVVGQLFEFVEDDELRELIRGVGVEELASVLEDVDDHVVADVIQQLEPSEQVETLAQLDRGEEVAELLKYEADSAGSIMSRGFIALNDSITVQQAIDYLRVLRPPSDRAYYLYVVDSENHLTGTVSIRDLLVSGPRTPLHEITQRDIYAVQTGTDQEEAARTFQKYNLMALPVVDEEGRLEGVMTADDLVDVLEEEATEDMYRMVGLDEHERIFSPVATSVRRRLPWMLINLLTAFVAAATVGIFDGTIGEAAVLALFMPVVAGMGGNAGTQTATIAVRSIALGDLGVRDVLRACRKEILVAMLNGLAIGLSAAIIAFIWKQNDTLSLIIGLALFLNICLATLAGVLIPLGLKAAKVDPALAANIFVTTITDVMGFAIFLGLGALAISQIR